MQDKDILFDRLLSEYIAQTISNKDKETLFSLVLESEIYKERYEEAVRFNTLLHLPYFEVNREKDFRGVGEKLNIERKARKIAWQTQLLRVVSVAIVLFTVSFGSIYIYKSIITAENTFKYFEASTPLGGQTRLLLPDGSVAWLNAKSELRYHLGFGITNRQLYLDGEGYFEVNKNEQLPFSISAGDMQVIATGTVFNVRSYKDDEQWEVNLLEGGVDVLIADKRYSLHSDEKAIYDKTTATVIVEATDASMASLWTKGRLAFYQASIPDIYKMLERHFNVKIRIESEELEKEYFLGSINLEMKLSDILDYLDVYKKYKIEIKNDEIVVKNK